MANTPSKQHVRTGGNAPFGYAWKDGVLQVIPEEARIYARMFELFLEHGRKRTVARLLNEEGYRTRADKEFSYSTVARLLENPIAKGERRVRQTRRRATGVDDDAEHEEIVVRVDPIVTEDTWNHAQALIANAGTQTRRPANHILSGKTHCTCGGKMYVPHKSKSYVCQSCRSKILIDDLHYIFHEKLKDLDFDDSDTLHRSWPDLDLEKQWQIVETITNGITVGDGTVALSFYSLS